MLKSWMLLMLFALVCTLPAGCGNESSTAPAGESPLTRAEPMDNAILAAITFVDIDFDAFPVLPEESLPEDGGIHVAKTGSDTEGDGSESSPYLTIVKAVDMAEAGDTIIVHEGVYGEQAAGGEYRAVIVSKDDITLMANPGDAVALVPANETVTFGLVLKGDNLVVRGLTIRDFAKTGILLNKESLSNVVLADLVVSNVNKGISSPYEQVNGALIHNVAIQNASFIGLDCGTERATNWRIEKASISINQGGSGSGADAFAIEDGDNILVVNSEFTGASADGIDTKATRVFVYGCYVHDVSRNGIKLWHGGDIVNTLVHHTGADAAIVVPEGTRTRLLHCMVAYHNFTGGESYNMTFGYTNHPTSTYEIINTIVYNTSGGAYFNPNGMVSIRNSIFYGMENNYLLTHGDTSVYVSQGAEGLNAYGAGNHVEDPLLDATFHPVADSPATNGGTALDTHYPLTDFNGSDRIQNGLPDIGPFESVW